MRTRSWRTTSGIGAQVFVTGAVAYTAKSLATLASTGVQGEIGVYREDTKAVIADSTAYDALAANVRVIIAMKTSTGLKTSESFTKAQLLRSTGGLYTAPVKQSSALGYDGTSGDLNIPSLTTSGVSLSASYIDISSMTQPADARTYTYVSRSGDTEYLALQGIMLDYARSLAVSASYNAYNASGQLALHYMDILSDVTTAQLATSVPANVTLTVTYGSKNVTASGIPATAVNGDYLRIGHATTKTFGIYKIASGAGSTAIVLDRPYTGGPSASGVAAGFVAAGTLTNTNAYGLKFTAFEQNQFFRVTASESLADATYQSDIVAFKLGVGTGEDVRDLENEGNVYAGYSTGNVAFTLDYGAPDVNSSLALTYSLIFLTISKQNKAVSTDGDFQVSYIVLAAPMLTSTVFITNAATTLTGTVAFSGPTGTAAASASPIIELADILIP